MQHPQFACEGNHSLEIHKIVEILGDKNGITADGPHDLGYETSSTKTP